VLFQKERKKKNSYLFWLVSDRKFCVIYVVYHLFYRFTRTLNAVTACCYICNCPFCDLEGVSPINTKCYAKVLVQLILSLHDFFFVYQEYFLTYSWWLITSHIFSIHMVTNQSCDNMLKFIYIVCLQVKWFVSVENTSIRIIMCLEDFIYNVFE